MLKDPSLLREAALVGAAWVPVGSAALTVTNPATGETVGRVPNLGAAETEAAIAAAEAAQRAWAARTAKDRATILRRWFDLMIENAEEKYLAAQEKRRKSR